MITTSTKSSTPECRFCLPTQNERVQNAITTKHGTHLVEVEDGLVVRAQLSGKHRTYEEEAACDEEGKNT